MSGNILYTRSEQTEKKYTIQQAIAFAQEYLKHKGYKMCCSSIPKRPEETPITLMELNNITYELVHDSLYYDVRF